MCLVALALDVHPRFPLVLASNRDEFFERPAALLDWWTPEGASRPVLGGRDLRNGGTWMALSAGGRLALVTNVRNPADNDAAAPSRGEIVTDWLAGAHSLDAFGPRLLARGYNGVNLLAADLAANPGWTWMSNRAGPPQRLAHGVHGLSNARLDTPWPKVERLKGRLQEALATARSADALAESLFHALADRTVPADSELPSTGVPTEWERWLAPAFIRTPDARYGTRCSTLLIAERMADGALFTRLIERSHAPGDGLPATERRVELPDWPPRPPALPGRR
ncbi:NRDE family protein [Caldimonas tepidiphila]|uniref:NRDE family protein n=1 Tax=Caldimonas tepidiphila TaxID=2315841 RepID=UPI000E5BF595|nr:NRDE family protein [Caldimonas tepidiphila]